ncbi:MAG: cupredoxin domain-containing protein [Pseudonocardia sp.]|nr:cupredoxin domain-containing protein [Pseudonocardia sp.]
MFEWRHGARSARRTLAALLICGLVALAGCSAPPVAAGVALQPDTIVIKDFSFQPGGVVVTPGATITVINNGVTAHTVTAIDKEFDSGVVNPSSRTTITAPTTPGKYLYLCMFHQYMRGFVSVVPAGRGSSRSSSG